MTLHFDGIDTATDDDAEIDGDMGLLSGARAVFRVTREYPDNHSYPDAFCELVRLTSTDGKRTIAHRPAAILAFGIKAIHRLETDAGDALTEQFKRGEAA